MQTSRKPDSLEWLLLGESFPYLPQNGHFPLCPLNAPAAAFRQGLVFYI